MDSRTLHDDMVEYIRKNTTGVTSLVLAESFLKFKNPDPLIAHTAIAAIMKRDRRCICGNDGLWHLEKKYDVNMQKPVCSIPWAAVHILTGRQECAQKAMHVSIWSPFQAPACLISAWLINPASLSFEERDMLTSGIDQPFEGRDNALLRILKILDNKIALYLSSHQQRILAKYCLSIGESPCDDTLLISQLFRILGLTVPKPVALDSCFRFFLSREPQVHNACQYGEALAECARELIVRLPENGITTREELDISEQKSTLCTDWRERAFSLSDVAALPQVPGVYGFTNRARKYFYIGKAKNLRRRLLSYFRDSEESPKKLRTLREQAYDLTVYRCGSELESLLFEHRLIRKYRPVYNTMTEIGERKGVYSPLQDCIVLLPHAEENKVMSFWFRREQKVLIRPLDIDFRESKELFTRLETFFFTKSLPAVSTDFPEQEIVFRWVKRHMDSLSIVPVYRMSSAEEVLDAMKSYRVSIRRDF
jgi:hypothetical protein